MRLAWLTDIHLNFLGTQQIETFLQTIAAQQPDALLITGDIGEAPSWADYMQRMGDTLACPIYFTLGNHDYYHGHIEPVRRQAAQLTAAHPRLHWLPACGSVGLTHDVALVGHGGWGDAGNGDLLRSSMWLNDYRLIRDFARLNKRALRDQLQALGREAADHLQAAVSAALATHNQVIVGTHVPPYLQAAWHAGRTPDASSPYAPHFTCRAVGDTLLNLAMAYPNKRITVLCGHTHGQGSVQMKPNLQVITGGATYGLPTIQRTFDLMTLAQALPKRQTAQPHPWYWMTNLGGTLQAQLRRSRPIAGSVSS